MMPWETPPVQDALAIPAFLKRDANNIAPYMNVTLVNPDGAHPWFANLWSATSHDKPKEHPWEK